MADISQLGNLNASEPLDLPLYKDAKEFSLPKKGVYTVRAPESFPPTTFGASKSGFLTAAVDPTIVGPSNEGFTVRFTRVSAKSWKDKSGVTISQLGRYLRATGLRDTVEGNPQAQADAVERTANVTYKIKGDWRAYNTATGFTLEGMEKFPSDGNGGHLSYCVDPGDFERDEAGQVRTDTSGNPIQKRLRAQFYVREFLSS
jgi:hypothetical protein